MTARVHLPSLVLLTGVVVCCVCFGPDHLRTLALDAPPALGVLAAAAGLGVWVAKWMRLAHRELLQVLCIATALGLGLLGVIVLGLGAAGALNRATAVSIVSGGVVLGGIWTVRSHRARRGAGASGGAEARTAQHAVKAPAGSAVTPTLRTAVLQSAMLLTLAIPAAIMLFGATLPPGLIWRGEANGYDALEYHLQGPREYFQNGRITFLPHNVYTSFPQQVEMLYLLLMHLTGGPYAAAIPAQLLHAFCGVLTVLALAAWTPPGWPRITIAVAAGSISWIAYLGCLAYVENGMLFYAAVAGGLVLDHERDRDGVDWRTTAAAGLCTGFAAGCKYTAVALVAAALGLSWLRTMRAAWPARLRRFALFGVAAALAFSPWLIRNAAFTGNPVYPFAYEWFDGRAWSAEQSAQWARGHRLPDGDRSPLGVLQIARRELSGPLSMSIVLLAVIGGIFRLPAAARFALIWAALVLIGWFTLTHMPARFALPIVVPLAILAQRAFAPIGLAATGSPAGRLFPALWIALAAASGILNHVVLIGAFRAHALDWHKNTGVDIARMAGDVATLRAVHPLNQTPPDADLWLVGDAAVFYIDRPLHYTVVFSRDPWLELARGGASAAACLDWLRTQNVTHVVFSWAEIDRLRRSYGFSEVITPAWVEALRAAGLRRVSPAGTPTGRSAVEVYEVPPK